jgi:hypothetical protein
MTCLEDVATAVLARDGLRARSLLQDFARRGVDLSSYPCPVGVDASTLTMTAAILELLAAQRNEQTPDWVERAGTFAEEFFVSQRALTTASIREACRHESPEALRRRNIFAPASFFTTA